VHGDDLTAGDEPALHGYELTPADARLLRGPPPPRALAWCEAMTGGRVAQLRALDGGTSSAVHALDLADGRALVLRRYVRADWLAEEPGVARREAAALALLRDSSLPTPRLVASDPTGADAGDPAVLMSRLPGAIEWRPHDLEGFLRGLADLLPAIHGTPPGPGIPDYAPYALETRCPPAWTSRPDLWERAFAVFDEPPPSAERRFIHRDFHPGNVLWTGGAVTGVVDWASTSIGAPSADIGHCRMNLAGVLGLGAADRFLALTGQADYHPYWDIVAALGGFGAATLARWTPRQEEFMARAAASI
jgi:aminoglycoside phosphotransferase (APT) family kinase protein